MVTGWTERAYGDPDWYLEQRADVIVHLGPRLERGDTLLDLACGDGALADQLPNGVAYVGVDLNDERLAVARARGLDVVRADLNEYVPAQPVDVTTCFRAIYYARDRRAFLEHVRTYTKKKLVFDLNPRQYRVADVREDVLAAGYGRFELQPLFVSQRFAVAPSLGRALRRLEHVGPVSRALLRFRFTYVCAASR